MRLSLPWGASRGLAAFAIVLAVGVTSPQFVFAQSKSEAELVVRVQQLEDEVRTLTGQVEGLQFQLTQMQTLIQKMQDDNEFRFQQLEGGDGKKSKAATQSGGDTPTGALPQAPSGEQSQTTQDATTTPPADVGGGTDATANADAAANADTTANANGGAMDGDGLGDSQDPLVGKGGGEATLGTLDGTSRPLDLSLNASQELSNGDAKAQYQAGYEAIVRGDYQFAEDQFRQFIALYPKDPEAPDATNWLGEALLQRQAYDEAADVLLTGFQNYEKSTRAPDILLKLGVALAGAGEGDTACRTFAEVIKRYPKQPPAFMQKLGEEKQKAQCPA